jgi:hypothetical protein
MVTPLRYYEGEEEWIKRSYVKVTLRYLYDLQNITDEFEKKVLNLSMNFISMLLFTVY